MKEKFEFWLTNVAKKSDGNNYKERTVKHYVSGIEAIKKEFGVNFWNLNDSEEILEAKYNLECNNDFIKKDQTGNKMYSCALDRLIDYTYYQCNDMIEKDIAEIESDDDLTLEEKDGFIESMINMRNPQFHRHFKKELMREFKSKCALCDINDKRLLIASHIIPYRDCKNKSEMYKSYNGLLLCVDHDALFDKHLISFKKDGNIMINKTLDRSLYNLLNINEDLTIDKKYLYAERLLCMKSHNKKYYEKNDF